MDRIHSHPRMGIIHTGYNGQCVKNVLYKKAPDNYQGLICHSELVSESAFSKTIKF
ncbi:MAG: hypothetical protein SPJ89_02460 [Treponema sp.]|nr:hypothetical protein [Spirochaetia bacterium]MDD7460270.1 hypothetical protein [Spirochaetales bacterium]MDY5810821.1 hypothetical protein [Treponema sp.]